MNLNNFAEKHWKMTITVYVLLDLQREIKNDFVFVRKTRTRTVNVHMKQIFSRFFKATKFFPQFNYK